MAFNLVIPEINKKSTKDLIIVVLARDWPQTNKQIYHNIKRRINKTLTFQAVYKALQELVGDNVLLKYNKNYQLNIKWINSLVEFSKRLQFHQYEKYHDTRHLFFTPDEYIYVLTFNNLKQWDECQFSTEEEYFRNHPNEHREIIYQMKHNWWPIIYGKSTLKHFDFVAKSPAPYYFFFNGDSVLDRLNSTFYTNLGAHTKTSVPCAENFNTLVYGNTVIHLYLPNELSAKISSIYSQTKNLQDLNIPKFISEVIDKPYEIKVIFYKNKDVAESIRKNALTKFSDTFNENNLQIFEFNSLLQFWKFIEEHFEEKEDKMKIDCVYHPWWTLLDLKRRQRKSKKTTHLLIGGNTPLDQDIAKLYKTQRVKLQLSCDYAKLNEFFLFDDEIFEYHLSKNIHESIDKFFKKVSRISDCDLDEYLKLFNEKGKIKVIINKDPFVVKRLKEKMLEFFNQNANKSGISDAKEDKMILSRKPIENFYFETLNDFYEFALKTFASGYLGPLNKQEPSPAVCIFNNMWIPLAASREQFKCFENILKQSQIYLLCKNNTTVNRWIAKIYTKFSAKVKLGVGKYDECDYAIGDDAMAQVFFDDNLKKALEKFYSAKPINLLNINKLYKNIFDMKTKIYMVITRNPELCKRKIKEVINYFNETNENQGTKRQ